MTDDDSAVIETMRKNIKIPKRTTNTGNFVKDVAHNWLNFITGVRKHFISGLSFIYIKGTEMFRLQVQ